MMHINLSTMASFFSKTCCGIDISHCYCNETFQKRDILEMNLNNLFYVLHTVTFSHFIFIWSRDNRMYNKNTTTNKMFISGFISSYRYLDEIEQALSCGEVVLIENIKETVDPLLEPLLGKQTLKKGRQVLYLCDDHSVKYVLFVLKAF